mmetsp:Transcript_53303/g.125261  ORF Transcript_53303/g.125261 Transcript_53303/m.125261 type:complete len:268 (+) Transcript_53303:4249-5052(+)
MKNGPPCGPFVRSGALAGGVGTGLFALAAEDAEQGQQALEHVVDVQVNGQRRGDVVGFAAIHHALDVVEHEGRKDAQRHHQHRQHQGRGLQEDVGDAGHHQDHRADHQELAQRGQVALDDGGEAGHREEDRSRAAEGRHHQRRAVLEAQHEADQPGQHQAHEKGEAQQGGNARGAVFGLLDDEHQAEGADEEDQRAHARAHQAEEPGGDTDPGAEHGGDKGQGQQPVGVAQHALTVGGKAHIGITKLGLQAVVHGDPPKGKWKPSRF